MIRFTVRGHLWSMKNGKIARRGGFPVKHPKCRQFEHDFLDQVPKNARQCLSGPLRSIVTAFYPSERQDLDCSLVYDLLQKAGVIGNDRQIKEKHEYRSTDKINPRVEIQVEEL